MNASHPGWNRAIFVLSFVGVFVAAFLWKMHATPQDIPCGPSHGCADVANSPYSRFPFGSGPPVAAYGTIGYAALTVLAFLRTLLGDTGARDRTILLLILAGATLGAVASLGLTYLELFVIHAICKWCVASQTIILIVFGIATREWLQTRRAA